MTKKKLFLILGGGLLALIICVSVVVWAIVANASNDDAKYSDNELPVMRLTLNGVTFEEIASGAKNIKYPGNSLKLYDDGSVQEFTEVELKGRGNSTWDMAKKPLQIKLEDKADLFGLNKARKWVLIANLFDFSKLRNDVAANVANMLDIGQAQKGQYLELYIDDEYQGLYYLTHKPEIDKNVVDLRNSMGVLVEVDNLHGLGTGCYTAEDSTCIIAKDLVSEDLEAEAMGDFMTNFNLLIQAARDKDFTMVESLIDVKSFAEYYLLSEFTVNPDAYISSWFMYKDGVGDKIHAGPGWDFDYALGNKNWIWRSTDDFYSPENDMIREIDAMGGKFVVDGQVIEKEADGIASKLIYYLMKIPEFREEVDKVFREQMSGRKNELLMDLRWQASKIYSASLRDSEKWGVPLEGEVEYLIDWVSRRFDHFEKTYGTGEEGENVNMTEV